MEVWTYLKLTSTMHLNNNYPFGEKDLTLQQALFFNSVEYFYVGESGTDGSESKNRFILANNRSDEDKFLKQAVIDTLIVKIIEQINDKIKKMNQLIK